MNVQGLGRVLAMVGVAWLAGCGGADCEEALEALCQKACDCGDGTSCGVSFEGQAVAGTSVDACVKTLTKLGGSCGDDDTNDYSACLADVEEAECVEGRSSVEGPASCAPPN